MWVVVGVLVLFAQISTVNYCNFKFWGLQYLFHTLPIRSLFFCLTDILTCWMQWVSPQFDANRIKLGCALHRNRWHRRLGCSVCQWRTFINTFHSTVEKWLLPFPAHLCGIHCFIYSNKHHTKFIRSWVDVCYKMQAHTIGIGMPEMESYLITQYQMPDLISWYHLTSRVTWTSHGFHGVFHGFIPCYQCLPLFQGWVWKAMRCMKLATPWDACPSWHKL